MCVLGLLMCYHVKRDPHSPHDALAWIIPLLKHQQQSEVMTAATGASHMSQCRLPPGVGPNLARVVKMPCLPQCPDLILGKSYPILCSPWKLQWVVPGILGNFCSAWCLPATLGFVIWIQELMEKDTNRGPASAPLCPKISFSMAGRQGSCGSLHDWCKWVLLASITGCDEDCVMKPILTFPGTPSLEHFLFWALPA